MWRDAAIARERSLYVSVPEILVPSLEVLDGRAHPLAELDEGVSERVRIEIGKAGTREGIAKDLPDWRGVTPERGLEALDDEAATRWDVAFGNPSGEGMPTSSEPGRQARQPRR